MLKKLYKNGYNKFSHSSSKISQPIYMEDTSSDFQSSSSTTDCITSQEQNTPINLVKRGSGIYFE